jgi:hypothetical protein
MQGPQSEDTKRSKREKGLPTLPLHLCTTYVLSQEPDFLGEISALEEVILKYGYRMIKSPKCHPEVAGTGIEYIWGFSKSRFRNKTNDGVPKNLEKNILKSLSIIGTENLCHERVMRYARKSRDYIMAYKAIYENKANTGVISKALIENMTKKHKAHRNMIDISSRFITGGLDGRM